MYKVTIEEVVPPVEGSTSYNREKTLYVQYVETLDVKKVIAVVNELSVVSNFNIDSVIARDFGRDK